MLSRENSFFILSQRIQRGDDDRGVSRENDSFFLIFATWASPLQGHSINNIFKDDSNSKIPGQALLSATLKVHLWLKGIYNRLPLIMSYLLDIALAL